MSDEPQDAPDDTKDAEAARAAARGSPYLTTKQAAYYLGFTAAALHAMRGKGRGPRFARFGRAIRYHIRDLEAYGIPAERVENANA